MSRRENYAADALPYRVLYLTAGVDVQDDRIEVEVVGWRAEKRGQPKESLGAEVLILHGDPAKPEIWEQLDEVLRRDWTTEDGRRLRLGAAAIDSAVTLRMRSTSIAARASAGASTRSRA